MLASSRVSARSSGRQLDDPLGDLEVVVGPVVRLQVGRRPPVVLERRAGLVGALVELAEPHHRPDVLGIEVHHPLQRVEEPGPVPRLLVGGGDELELRHRLAEQAELLVEGRQPLVDADVLRVELDHLLEDGHRLEEEPLVRVGLGHPLEGVGRHPVVALLLVELADLEQDPDVLGILLEDPVVRRDRLVVGPLLDELGGLGDDLVLVDCHRTGSARGARDRTTGPPGETTATPAQTLRVFEA